MSTYIRGNWREILTNLSRTSSSKKKKKNTVKAYRYSAGNRSDGQPLPARVNKLVHVRLPVFLWRRPHTGYSHSIMLGAFVRCCQNVTKKRHISSHVYRTKTERQTIHQKQRSRLHHGHEPVQSQLTFAAPQQTNSFTFKGKHCGSCLYCTGVASLVTVCLRIVLCCIDEETEDLEM